MKKLQVILFLITSGLMIISCANNSDSPDGGFKNPERITITGYSGDQWDKSPMEPFISRDSQKGRYLFFNNSNESSDPNIHFTERDPNNELNFIYRGPLSINTDDLDGVPTMDQNNTFYYVSNSDFIHSSGTDLLLIHKGTFTGNDVSGRVNVVDLFTGLPNLNFDVEVSPDGKTLYFADGEYSGPFLIKADIAVAKYNELSFKFERVDNIMTNINTTALEYAASISSDGLELFFTRWELPTASHEPRIYRAYRNDTTEAFGTPELMSVIDGYVEAPSLSLDGSTLYYHKRISVIEGKNKFGIFRVIR